MTNKPRRFDLSDVPQLPDAVNQRVIYGDLTPEDESEASQYIAEATAVLRAKYEANPSGLSREYSVGHARRLRAEARKRQACNAKR